MPEFNEISSSQDKNNLFKQNSILQYNKNNKHVILWEKCLKYIKNQIEDSSFNTWFKPIIPQKIENNTLTIQVPSKFFYEWLEEHYIAVLKKAIFSELGSNGKLSYSIIVGTKNDQVQLDHNKPNLEKKEIKQTSNFFYSKNKISLNAKYSFENFIEGDSNQLAYSAALSISKNPGKTAFNPLLIYGKVGLGKTHLLQAIGIEILRNNKTKKIEYISSEKFTSNFIEAIKKNKVQDFLQYYLEVDVLLIDDIQFLANKEKTQEIFFHIFNHLHQNNKQIVITSDCPPKSLNGLEERLLSRFKWGLTADIKYPDYETRIAIIHSKLDQESVSLNPEHIKYLATCLDSNIRELEGVIVSVIAHSSLRNTEVSLDLIQNVLNNIIKKQNHEINIEYIQNLVSDNCKVNIKDLKSSSRKKEVVLARQLAMYLCKNYTNHSLKSIGESFGGKHHSTVIHAIQNIEDWVTIDISVKKQLSELIELINLKIKK